MVQLLGDQCCLVHTVILCRLQCQTSRTSDRGDVPRDDMTSSQICSPKRDMQGTSVIHVQMVSKQLTSTQTMRLYSLVTALEHVVH
jgi:hypothetical protein